MIIKRILDYESTCTTCHISDTQFLNLKDQKKTLMSDVKSKTLVYKKINIYFKTP